MTDVPDMENVIADLEGATQALNNFATSQELTIETEYGLKWLALQIDRIMVELREKWDAAKAEQGPKLETGEPPA